MAADIEREFGLKARLKEGHDGIFEVAIGNRRIYTNSGDCSHLPKNEEILRKINVSCEADDQTDPKGRRNSANNHGNMATNDHLTQKMGTDPNLDKPWITGKISTPAGDIPVVSSMLTFSDRLGSYKARWAIGRMKYRVDTGLYAVGHPDNKSLVFVSANYKMSFDRLRSQLDRIDCWILVLDTRGINVWCAAGKGTFGTDEIVRRIETVRLKEIVSHRKLILPQLGAPGVSAHKVKEYSGFRVIYGPVRARDIAAFLTAGNKATPDMRRVKFGFRDRMALIPTDLVLSAKYLLLVAACFLLLSGIGPGIYSFDRVARYGAISVVLLAITYAIGTVLPIAFLPWLPGRAFSIKGAFIGIPLALGIAWYMLDNSIIQSTFGVTAWLFIIPAVISFIAMNFTGSSTYTSLSGVRKEMRAAVPAQIVSAALGVGLWITGLFI